MTPTAETATAMLQAVITEMTGPVPEVERSAGWTPDKQDRILKLLTDWQRQIQTAGELRPGHFKAIGRWFLDEEVGQIMTYDPPDPWSEKIVEIDNFISRSIGN
jgi:hypothetical protein